MTLADLLNTQTVSRDLDGGERDDVLRAMLDRLASSGKVAASTLGALHAALVAREDLGSTAIGRGVAVPHARTDEVDGLVAAFGYCPAGVEFNSLDGQPVHHIFLLLGPMGAADEYTDTIQRITHLVQNEDFCRFVTQARSDAEVLDLIAEMEAV